MPARGDDVAEKIESQVREAIVKMVSDIRSSIEDVRDAVVQQLQAAMQSVQADANSLSIRPQLQQVLRDLGPMPAAAPPAGADVRTVKRAIQAVERGTSQIDILNALLDQSLQFGSRAALLILKGDVFSGWKGVGFSAHGGNDEAIKRFSAAASAVAELDRLLRNEQVVAWPGASLASRFGVAPAKQAVLIPMVIKDKVSAAMYVDSFEPAKLQQTALELLVFTTGLLIDTMTIRKKIPSPSLSSEEAEPTVMMEEPFAEPTVAVRAQPTVAIPQPSRMATPSPRPTREFEIESESAAFRRATTPPSADTLGTPPAQPRPAAPPPSAPVDLGERPSTQYIPPAGMKPGARFAASQPEDAKRHDEARRFARLLVSEIKLYNESKVEQGRKHKDIYERLKEDIDRSRQMYDDRIPEKVRKGSNYFYDELVRILANGDAEALGL